MSGTANTTGDNADAPKTAMKTVCFFNSTGFWGGGEKLHLEYALEFQRKGYRTLLVCAPGSPLAQRGRDEGLPVMTLAVFRLSFLDPLKLLQLRGWFRHNHVDTVIVSTSRDLKLAGLAARFAGLQRIVYLRGLAVQVKANVLNRFLFRSLSHIVANSEETRRMVLSHLASDVSRSKVSVVYHGIDVEAGSGTTLPEVVDRARGVVLGNAGRLTAQKGQRYLIEVAQHLVKRGVEFTLFVAGSGELHDELKQLAEERDVVDRVVFLGFVPDVDAFMNSIDIFVLSSAWEGFGYVLVEAMKHGKPVVAFDASSNPEIVAAGETGFLVEFPDVLAFADRVQALILDPELRRRMGQAGRRRVVERFEIHDRIDEFERVLLQ